MSLNNGRGSGGVRFLRQTEKLSRRVPQGYAAADE